MSIKSDYDKFTILPDHGGEYSCEVKTGEIEIGTKHSEIVIGYKKDKVEDDLHAYLFGQPVGAEATIVIDAKSYSAVFKQIEKKAGNVEVRYGATELSPMN